MELAAKCEAKAKELQEELLAEGEEELTGEMIERFKKFRYRLVDGEEIPDELLEILGG